VCTEINKTLLTDWQTNRLNAALKIWLLSFVPYTSHSTWFWAWKIRISASQLAFCSTSLYSWDWKQVTLSNTCHWNMVTLSNPGHSKQFTIKSSYHSIMKNNLFWVTRIYHVPFPWKGRGQHIAIKVQLRVWTVIGQHGSWRLSCLSSHMSAQDCSTGIHKCTVVQLIQS
jgi:hypothetical protein